MIPDGFSFLQGLAVGFALAVPVGPVGLLCLRRALAEGRWESFITGTGAAVADSFYGAVAVLGLTVISGFLLRHSLLIRLGGGLLVLGLALQTWRQPPEDLAVIAKGPGPLRDFLTSLTLTLTNPGTILAAMGIFATLGGVSAPEDAALTIFGVFCGSCLWWMILSSLGTAVRGRFSRRWMIRLNHGSAVLLLLFGLGLLISVALG